MRCIHECNLQPGESETFCFQIGHVMEKEEIAPMHKQLEKGVPQQILKAVIDTRAAQISGITIKTPDEMLNKVINGFYLYSTNMGSRWARVRHNGYRDMCHDNECLATFNPELAWERFKWVLSFRYSNGYAPRTIKEGRIRDNNYIDCAMWIPLTTHTIVTELGKKELLLEEIPFNDGTSATLYEHARRALDYLYHFHGENGLIKIWGGDWNDGMNMAGLEGKGTSVWLSITWRRANNRFIELAEDLSCGRILLKFHPDFSPGRKTPRGFL